MKWRIIIHKKKSAAENMAIDEAIMNGISHKTSIPTIRFYDWTFPTASCGYNQIAEEEVDFNILKEKGYEFVRRPTGGRLVLHKNEITYSVISPLNERLEGNVLDTYSEISKALANGLKRMGVPVEFEKGTLNPMEQRQANNPCFTSSSRYELNCLKKKIVGSAQVRSKNVLLQHGSILLNDNQSEIAFLLPNIEENRRIKLAKFLERKTISINKVTKKNYSYEQAVKFLVSGFIESWKNDTFAIGEFLTQNEKNEVKKLVTEKYSTQKWNLKK